MEDEVRISFFADEAVSSLSDQTALAKSLGLSYIEVRSVDGRNISSLSLQETHQVAHLLRSEGIGVSALASPVGKSPLDAEEGPVLETLAHVCSQAVILGTGFVRIFSFYPSDDGTDATSEVIRRLSLMTEIARKHGVTLLHENEAAVYGHSSAACAILAKALYGPSFALAYDPGNFVWGEGIKDNVACCWPVLKPYVRHIHLKDWICGSKGPGVLFGDGDACIRDLVGELARCSYRGFVTMEPHMQEGGRFGGSTSPSQFSLALGRLKSYLEEFGLNYI